MKGNIKNIDKATVEAAIKDITDKEMVVDQALIDSALNTQEALDQYQYEGAAGPSYVQAVNTKFKKTIKNLSSWTEMQNKIQVKTENDLYSEVINFCNS